MKRALGIEEDFGLTWLNCFRHDSESAQFLSALATKLTEEAVSLYRSIKAKNPNALSERMMNSVGYELLRGGDQDKAIAIFKLNVESYPRSANPYDSLGEAYERSGNKVLAAEYYQKALDAIPTDPTRDEASRNQFKETVQENPDRVKSAK